MTTIINSKTFNQIFPSFTEFKTQVIDVLNTSFDTPPWLDNTKCIYNMEFIYEQLNAEYSARFFLHGDNTAVIKIRGVLAQILPQLFITTQSIRNENISLYLTDEILKSTSKSFNEDSETKGIENHTAFSEAPNASRDPLYGTSKAREKEKRTTFDNTIRVSEMKDIIARLAAIKSINAKMFITQLIKCKELCELFYMGDDDDIQIVLSFTDILTDIQTKITDLEASVATSQTQITDLETSVNTLKTSELVAEDSSYDLNTTYDSNRVLTLGLTEGRTFTNAPDGLDKKKSIELIQLATLTSTDPDIYKNVQYILQDGDITNMRVHDGITWGSWKVKRSFTHRPLPNLSDLNTLIGEQYSGQWSWGPATGQGITNKPDSATKGQTYSANLLVMGDDWDSYTTQLMTIINTNEMFVRTRDGANWSDWDKIVTFDDVFTKDQTKTLLTPKTQTSTDVSTVMAWMRNSNTVRVYNTNNGHLALGETPGSNIGFLDYSSIGESNSENWTRSYIDPTQTFGATTFNSNTPDVLTTDAEFETIATRVGAFEIGDATAYEAWLGTQPGGDPGGEIEPHSLATAEAKIDALAAQIEGDVWEPNKVITEMVDGKTTLKVRDCGNKTIATDANSSVITAGHVLNGRRINITCSPPNGDGDREFYVVVWQADGIPRTINYQYQNEMWGWSDWSELPIIPYTKEKVDELTSKAVSDAKEHTNAEITTLKQQLGDWHLVLANLDGLGVNQSQSINLPNGKTWNDVSEVRVWVAPTSGIGTHTTSATVLLDTNPETFNFGTVDPIGLISYGISIQQPETNTPKFVYDLNKVALFESLSSPTTDDNTRGFIYKVEVTFIT